MTISWVKNLDRQQSWAKGQKSKKKNNNTFWHMLHVYDNTNNYKRILPERLKPALWRFSLPFMLHCLGHKVAQNPKRMKNQMSWISQSQTRLFFFSLRSQCCLGNLAKTTDGHHIIVTNMKLNQLKQPANIIHLSCRLVWTTLLAPAARAKYIKLGQLDPSYFG